MCEVGPTRTSASISHQIVDVLVPQHLEERIAVFPQKRISKRIGDQIVDVPVLHNLEERAGEMVLVPQERVPQQTGEHTIGFEGHCQCFLSLRF